jgi:hypothetical protein
VLPAGPSRDSGTRQTFTEKESVIDDLSISKCGAELLRDPTLNKSTDFTEAERQGLDLVGLVSDTTESEDLQLRRVMQQLGHKATDLDRYIYLVNLLDHDETCSIARSCPIRRGSCR